MGCRGHPHEPGPRGGPGAALHLILAVATLVAGNRRTMVHESPASTPGVIAAILAFICFQDVPQAMGVSAYGASTAMQRAQRRMRKQQKGMALTRSMGIFSGAAAPAAYLILGGAAGFASAAFLAFAGLFLLVNSVGK